MFVYLVLISVLLLGPFVINSADPVLIAVNQLVPFKGARYNFDPSTPMNLTTVYVTSTGQQDVTIYNIDFNIEPARGQPCAFFHLGLNASKGQHLTGNLTSSSRISFYLIYDSDYQLLLKDFHCQISNPVVDGENVMTYSFTFIVPSDTDYELLFFNESKDSIPKVSFTLMTTRSATTTIVMTEQSTQTLTQITPIPSRSLWYDTILLMAVLIPITLGCVMAYMKLAKSRRRNAHGKPDSKYDEYLTRLESLRGSGRISQTTYAHLKAEYENRRLAKTGDA